MPGCDGVAATRRITADHPGTRVVMLTTYADDESIISALQAGALGYLTKDATRAEIGRAVLAAAAGQAVLDPGSSSGYCRPRLAHQGRLARLMRHRATGISRRAKPRCSGSSRPASPTGRSPGHCSSARRRSRRTLTGPLPRPGHETALRQCATPTPTGTPNRRHLRESRNPRPVFTCLAGDMAADRGWLSGLGWPVICLPLLRARGRDNHPGQDRSGVSQSDTARPESPGVHVSPICVWQSLANHGL